MVQILRHHMAGFYSFTKKQEYTPGIVLTPERQENSKYAYTFHTKDFEHLEAIKTQSNEQFIEYLASLGYMDVEFFPTNDWFGLRLISTES